MMQKLQGKTTSNGNDNMEQAKCPNCGYIPTGPNDIFFTAYDGMGECPKCKIILSKYLKKNNDKLIDVIITENDNFEATEVDEIEVKENDDNAYIPNIKCPNCGYKPSGIHDAFFVAYYGCGECPECKIKTSELINKNLNDFKKISLYIQNCKINSIEFTQEDYVDNISNIVNHIKCPNCDYHPTGLDDDFFTANNGDGECPRCYVNVFDKLKNNTTYFSNVEEYNGCFNKNENILSKDIPFNGKNEEKMDKKGVEEEVIGNKKVHKENNKNSFTPAFLLLLIISVVIYMMPSCSSGPSGDIIDEMLKFNAVQNYDKDGVMEAECIGYKITNDYKLTINNETIYYFDYDAKFKIRNGKKTNDNYPLTVGIVKRGKKWYKYLK